MKLEVQEKELIHFFDVENSIIIFDIGAHIGDSTERYKTLFPNSKIYCFEPVPYNFERLCHTIKDIQDVKAFAIALSNKNGEIEFHLSSGTDRDGSRSSSILPPSEGLKNITPWLEFKEQVIVPTKTLDSFCVELNIECIDFIHMDVQGAELLVLNGAKNMLDKIKVIWLEVENVELYKGQPLKKDIEIFMKTYGFIKIIDNVDWISGDQMWVSSKHLQDKKSKTYVLKMKAKIEITSIYFKVRRILGVIKRSILL